MLGPWRISVTSLHHSAAPLGSRSPHRERGSHLICDNTPGHTSDRHSPVCTESHSWFVHPTAEWAVRSNFPSQHPAAYWRSQVPSKTNISLPASSPGQDLAPRTDCTRTADLRLQEVQGFGVLPQAAKAGSYIWKKAVENQNSIPAKNFTRQL